MILTFPYSLREACSHVAAVLSCMIKTFEERKEKRELDLCTLNLCSWNHSSKEVQVVDLYVEMLMLITVQLF